MCDARRPAVRLPLLTPVKGTQEGTHCPGIGSGAQGQRFDHSPQLPLPSLGLRSSQLGLRNSKPLPALGLRSSQLGLHSSQLGLVNLKPLPALGLRSSQLGLRKSQLVLCQTLLGVSVLDG